MPTLENFVPDVVIGHHPDFGIVATTPHHRAVTARMLRTLDFQPVPDHRNLYRLLDHENDGQARATHAVALLRAAKFRVHVDIAFDPTPAFPTVRAHPKFVAPDHGMPDVAIAEHPQLGLVAATTDGVPLARQLLTEHGWALHPQLDIYTLPPATDREDGLSTVALTTVALDRAGLQVAVQPPLARDATTHLTNGPSTATPRRKNPDEGDKSPGPIVTHGAVDRSGLPDKPPLPTPAASPPTDPAAPRGASSRTR